MKGHEQWMSLVRRQYELLIVQLEQKSEEVEKLTTELESLDSYLSSKIEKEVTSTDEADLTAIEPVVVDVLKEASIATQRMNDAAAVAAYSGAFLPVNFGGKCVTLDRQTICNSKIKYNFFSALFHPRWQRVLPRDKAGRLYLEVDYKWIEPILDAYELARYDTSTVGSGVKDITEYMASIRGSSPSMTMELASALGFTANNKHHQLLFTPSIEMAKVIDLLYVKNLLKSHIQSLFKDSSLSHEQHEFCQFKLTETTLSSSSIAMDQTTDKLILGVAPNGLIYGFLFKRGIVGSDDSSTITYRYFLIPTHESHQHKIKITSQAENLTYEEKVFDAKSQSVTINEHGVMISQLSYGNSLGHRHHMGHTTRPTRSEIFSISGGNYTCPPEWLAPTIQGGAVTVSVVEAYDIECVKLYNPLMNDLTLNVFDDVSSTTKYGTSSVPSSVKFAHTVGTSHEEILKAFTTSVNSSHESVDQTIQSLQNQFEIKYLEAKIIVSFLYSNSLRYFHFHWRSVDDKNDGDKDEDEEDDKDFAMKTHALYDEIAKYASPEKQEFRSDDVVWFNVRGESVCLLKSTILEFIPNSQLAIRFGGKWKEQSSTLDNEGRIIVDYPAQVFMPFVEYLRACKVLGIQSKVIIYASKAWVALAKQMLQYYAIEGLAPVCFN